MMQQTLRAAPTIKKRAKSVYQQRNLGTIKDRKREKKQEKEVNNGETILRILRMRYVISHTSILVMILIVTLNSSGTSDFIAQQLQILSAMQAEQEQRERAKSKAGSRKVHRPKQASQIPAVPPLPEDPSA